MTFNGYIGAKKRLIDKKLDAYIPGPSEKPAIIHKAMRYSVFSGGKRIRPIVTLESCVVCGGKQKHGLVAASAVELVHTYSLIHDDLPSMDDDDYRRGKPTCHKVFGEANAILAGDALLTLAFNILSRDLPCDIAAYSAQELSEAIGTRGMVGGQALDLEHKNSDRKTLNNINKLKTAMLFEASARLGAIVSGAGRKETKAMACYGACLGAAFQITDDILDGLYDSNNSLKKEALHNLRLLSGRAEASLGIYGRKARRMAEIAHYVIERIR